MKSKNGNQNKLSKLMANKEPDTSGTFPLSLQVEPSNFCNARCPLCPTGAGSLKRSQSNLELKVFNKIVKESNKFIQDIALWNYGEPFLNPNIFEMIEIAEQNGIETRVSTNGVVFYSSKMIDKLTRSRLSILIVSIDGITPETHSSYRVNVDLNKIVDGLIIYNEKRKKIKGKKTRIIIQSLALKQNENEISEIKDFAHSLGFEFRLKSVNLDMVDGDFNNKKNFLPKTPKSPVRYKVQGDNYVIKDSYNNFCPEVWTSMVINVDGQVSPCCYDYHGDIDLGNVNDDTIENIWSGEKMINFRKKILNEQHNISICKNCPIALKNTNNYRVEY